MRKILVAVGMAALTPATLLWLWFCGIAVVLQLTGPTRRPDDLWYAAGALGLGALGAAGLIALWFWLYMGWFHSPKQTPVRSWQLGSILTALPVAVAAAVRGVIGHAWIFPIVVSVPVFISLVVLIHWGMSPNNSFKPKPLRGSA